MNLTFQEVDVQSLTSKGYTIEVDANGNQSAVKDVGIVIHRIYMTTVLGRTVYNSEILIGVFNNIPTM